MKEPATGIVVGCAGHVFAETAPLAASSTLPKTSSANAVSVTASPTAFETVTLKVTVSPGSATEPADGLFVTSTFGSASVNSTVASSPADARLPSLSEASAVAVLTWSAPEASPETFASNAQSRVPPTGSVLGCAGQVFEDTCGLAGFNRSPNSLSSSASTTTLSIDVLEIEIEKVTGPPGSGIEPIEGRLRDADRREHVRGDDRRIIDGRGGIPLIVRRTRRHLIEVVGAGSVHDEVGVERAVEASTNGDRPGLGSTGVGGDRSVRHIDQIAKHRVVQRVERDWFTGRIHDGHTEGGGAAWLRQRSRRSGLVYRNRGQDVIEPHRCRVIVLGRSPLVGPRQRPSPCSRGPALLQSQRGSASNEHVNDPPTAMERGSVAQVFALTAPFEASSRFPNSLSVSASRVTASSERFATVTVKVHRTARFFNRSN